MATRRLDSMAVIGHSGATGFGSDPSYPFRDMPQNSWATGDNPEVRSLYLRLLADRPAMEDHNLNAAVSGSDVDDLWTQVDAVRDAAAVIPDVLVVLAIDNDVRCDGTDAANAVRFGRVLDETLDHAERVLPGVSFYLTSPWTTPLAFATWARRHEEIVRSQTGTGPCDVYTPTGEIRPAGLRSVTRIADGYWTALERVCARHPRCWTDGGADEEFGIRDSLVSPDLFHLSVAGQRRYAALAWRSFPEELKSRR